MLKEVLPFLLSSQGMESSAKDVRAFATVTVLKLIKSGGKALLNFIPDLVEQLLGLLSTFEMEGVDYLYLNAANYNLTEEKIDSARTTAVSHSPLMEAIERCLDQLDEPTMIQIVPRLENAIKTHVGMPSKVGCGAVLVSLATRHSFVFRIHADHFLKIMEKAVLDRNTAVSAGYARAAGYMCRLASEGALLKLASYAKDQYYTAEDEQRRQVAADIIYAVSKFATDRFNALAAVYLPFVFFAKHDLDEHVKDQFEKTWDENVGGSRAVLLYLREITDLSTQRLESPKWAIKHTAALAIAEATSSAGSDISGPNAAIIWPALEKALALKTFDGKGKVLDAFVKFTKAARSLWEKESSIASQMKKIAIREAKRNNDAYRPHAFTSLGEFSGARNDIDMFDDVYIVVAPILEELTSEDKMDTEDDNKASGKSEEAATITAGVSALFRAVNVKFLDPSPLTHLPKLLGTIKTILPSVKVTVATKLTLYERTKVLFDGLQQRTHSQGSSNYDLVLGYFMLLEVPGGSGSEIMRTKRAEAAEMVAKTLVGGVFGMHRDGRNACSEKMIAMVVEGRANERSPGVKTALDRVSEALKE
jgi:proteasome component ECM29